MKIIDGNKIANRIKKDIKRDLEGLKEKLGFTPKVVSIVVGDNTSSLKFSEVKGREAQKLGFDFERKIFKVNASENEVISYIKEKNQDKKVCGIIIQLPLPKKLSTRDILNSVDPQKDVDSLHVKNLELLVKQESEYLPPVVAAVTEILREINYRPEEKTVAIIGKGLVTGVPLRIYFESMGSRVILPSKNNLAERTKLADLVISATGSPGLIKGDFVKKGAVVIDVGYELVGEKVVGDVDFESVSKKASFLTPVPGGVGPVVVATLLRNCFIAAKEL